MLTIGVDAHKELLVAVGVDQDGTELEGWTGTNGATDWKALAAWARSLSAERVWGIEGSGNYGRGLAQYLVQHQELVYEINPRLTAAVRKRNRQPGKSDRRDALAIARAVRQEGNRLPRVYPDDVTAVVALLTAEREDALAEATRLRNQLHQVLGQLDPDYQQSWPSLRDLASLDELVNDPPAAETELAKAQVAMVCRVASRLALLEGQIAELAGEIEAQATTHYAGLTTLCGVGLLTAGMLAGLLGPAERFASDAHLAAYAGVAPLEASSAGVLRHRLNRTGNRQLNMLVHRIALTQARCSSDAQTYLARRQTEGKSWREAIRALKRFIIRRIWKRWHEIGVAAASGASV
jgi:transposase